MNNIKRCPHCGGAACLNSNYSFRSRTYFVFVKCIVCGSQGKIYNSEECTEVEEWNNEPCIKAVEAWNMRTEERVLEDA